MTPVQRACQKIRGSPSRSIVFLCTILATLSPFPNAALGAPDQAADAAATNAAPSEPTALTAYLAARAWLDAEQLPAEREPAARVPLEGTTSVSVLLRLDGRLVGAGHDALDVARSMGGASAAETELLLRRAVGRAVARALADTTIAAVRAEFGDRVTSRLSLEVELGGPLQPLIGRTVAEASRRISAGNEGVAVLRADRAHRAFPSRLLAADTASRVDRTIAGLILEAGLPAKDLPDFGAEDRVSLARFQITRLRADAPDAPPAVVTRAGRVVAEREVTEGFVRAAATQLAARLAAQVVPVDPMAPEGSRRLLGTLNPTADTYNPPFAAPSDAALASLALARAARSPLLPEPTRAQAAKCANALLHWLSSLPEGERSIAADCVAAVAAVDLDGGAEHGAALGQRIAEATRARLSPSDADASTDTATAALLAAAAVSLGDVLAPGDLTALVTRLRAAAEARPASLLDSALPLAQLLSDPRSAQALSAEDRGALLALFERFAALLGDLQLGDGVQGGASRSADLAGGIDLPGSPSGVADTQSLLVMTALAQLESASTPREWSSDARARAILRPYARFVIQHIATDPWVGGFRNPRALRGLVRGSLVRDDCPPGATSASLLYLLSTAESGIFRDGTAAQEASPDAAPTAPPEGPNGPK